MSCIIKMARSAGLEATGGRLRMWQIRTKAGDRIHQPLFVSTYYACMSIRLHAPALFRPVCVVAFSWMAYKDACGHLGLNWRDCVHVTKPQDLNRLAGAGSIYVDRSFYDVKGPYFEQIERELVKCQMVKWVSGQDWKKPTAQRAT
jgi:hypothetical protein